MGYEHRKLLIQALEDARGSRVLSYMLSDRDTFPPGLAGYSTALAGEPQQIVLDLLDEIGQVRNLDLFLYTRGGSTEAVWPLVTALRAHCERLAVIVPFRAHSAGTLLCLGADQVVMMPGSELSPIDPTTGNQFNPRDPLNAANQYGISVEDVVAYFDLAEERAEIRDEQYRTEVFKQLTAQVHPLALGNVQRVYMLIRALARKLLLLHVDEEQQATLKRIIEGLTTEFYSHIHSISLSEAEELLGDWVRAATAEEREAIRSLYMAYRETFGLGQKFNLPEVIGDEQTMDLHVLGALLETSESEEQSFPERVTHAGQLMLDEWFCERVPSSASGPMPGWSSGVELTGVSHIPSGQPGSSRLQRGNLG